MKNKDMEKTDFIARLIEIRKSKGITQKQMAERMGLKDKSMYCRYEQGIQAPSVSRFEEMLNLLGYELAEVPTGYANFAQSMCEQKAVDEEKKESTLHNYGNVLKEIRISKNVEQKLITSTLKMSVTTTISRYESNIITPKLPRYSDILNILGYEIAIVPAGYRDFAREIAEARFQMDNNK
ncbi:MAG: helix-turn-helix transcriptional regulator [Bacteroidaceae bacterium]|nr:helix-turn-helix transcriptional regulator [Bacteroidaceae bacterium]